jgi:hypothetical protein
MSDFYIFPDEVFRVGNATSPLMSKIRADEVSLREINGIRIVIANGRGISVFDAKGLEKSTLSGWVWKFAGNLPLVPGLKLIPDQDLPGYFHIAPDTDMPLDKYKGLLEEMGMRAVKVFKKAI